MSEENTAVIEKPTNSLVAGGGFEIDPTDLDIPRINVVQKMSESDDPVGSVLFDKRCVLAAPDTPLRVVAVAAQKGWREDIPFDEDDVPQIAWSKEQRDFIEAESDWGMIEFAEITLLIEKPDDCDDDSAFQIPLGDKDYALGKINVAKNAYRSTFKRLATFAALNQNVPVSSRYWNFTSEQITRGKYTWYNPSLTATKEDTPEEVTLFTQKFA
jgi:hypothetical protein